MLRSFKLMVTSVFCFLSFCLKSLKANFWKYPSLAVLPRIEPFHFPENLHSGQAVQVSCFVTEGDTPVKLSWRVNGKKLLATEQINFYNVRKKGSLLLIDPLTEEQTGNYTCAAENKAGSVDFTAQLSVNGTVVKEHKSN